LVAEFSPEKQQIHKISAAKIRAFNEAIGETEDIDTETNGLIVIAQVHQSIHDALPIKSYLYLSQSFKFRDPVLAGDELHLSTTVIDQTEDKVVLVTMVKNQHGHSVLEGESIVRLNVS